MTVKMSIAREPAEGAGGAPLQWSMRRQGADTWVRPYQPAVQRRVMRRPWGPGGRGCHSEAPKPALRNMRSSSAKV